MGFQSAIKTRLLIVLLLVSITACSEAPVYYGKTGKREVAESKPRIEPPITSIETDFTPPVYDFHTGRITSRFGVRKNSRYNYRENHKGIDINLETGDTVIASAPGRVTFTGNKRGFGKVVIISHGDRVYSVYAHLSTIDCRKGQYVDRGEAIGKGGKSGNATGSHLHFEIRKSGTAVDPLPYLLK